MRDPLRCFLAILFATLTSVGTAEARPLEVPTFPVDAGAEVVRPEVAVGTDGTMVVAWQAGAAILAQRLTQAGAAVAPPTTLASGTTPRLTADTRGGYVLAYVRDGDLHARRLDATGTAVGTEITVDDGADPVALPHVLGLPSGFALVWQQGLGCWLRRYDPDGVVLSPPFLVGDTHFLFPLAATALDDGGITVVWHDPSVHTQLARTFDGDGGSRAGPAFIESLAYDVQAIAATPTGGFVAAGVYLQSTLRLVEYDAAFAIVRQGDVEALPAGDIPHAALARDAVGRWLVVFTTADHDPTYTELLGYLAPRARPLAADLTPLEPSFAIGDPGALRVATALLPSGSFVNVWGTAGAPGDGRGFANVVSLCTPDVHTCGDGVLDARCEECDDGAANDDGTPNACRTSCRLPSCGDGVADAAEACDDGTVSPCDGCDGTCQPVAGLVCGDGILVAGCADQCDDGNAVVGDGCAPQCTYERVPGGGSAKTDCFAEWIVPNPTNVPLLDGRGRPQRTQRCADDDPACDFDGGTAGSCTFHVQVCANNTDVAGCTPPAALSAFELAKPSIAAAARKPALQAARAGFGGVPGALVGAATSDLCSSVLPVVVPLRGSAPSYGKGTLALGIVATAGGVRDKDTLKLICLP